MPRAEPILSTIEKSDLPSVWGKGSLSVFPMVHFLHLMVYTTSLPLRDSFTTACLILDSGLSGYRNLNTVLRQDEGANDYQAVLGLPTETQQRGGLKAESPCRQ
ncbi:hypothetical protein BHE90_008152 [Fusarium euwallaceae]|nr:hypothetical protein BHE90_008152 [Fusarium euwallaceae]